MKHLFRVFVISASIFFFTVPMMWSQFYSDLSMESRKELAEAYYLAGKQYEAIGKKDKGRDFVEMAFKIYPGLAPSEVKEPADTQKRPTTLRTSWEPSYPKTPPSVAPDRNLVLYQFTRFLRAFITEDLAVMQKVLDSSVYIDAAELWLPKRDIADFLQTAFDQYPIDEMPPSELLRLETIEVTKLSDFLWKGTVEITDVPRIGLNESINVDSPVQEFYFRPESSSWLIFAAGALPEKSEVVLFPQRYIGNSFLSCLNHFIEKRPGKASDYFTDPFYNIPLGTEVTREELAMTFLGYYEEYDVSALGNLRVSMDIAPADDYDRSSGKVFKLYATLTGDSGDVPFWEAFRGYYFVFDEKETAWKISAVF